MDYGLLGGIGAGLSAGVDSYRTERAYQQQKKNVAIEQAQKERGLNYEGIKANAANQEAAAKISDLTGMPYDEVLKRSQSPQQPSYQPDKATGLLPQGQSQPQDQQASDPNDPGKGLVAKPGTTPTGAPQKQPPPPSYGQPGGLIGPQTQAQSEAPQQAPKQPGMLSPSGPAQGASQDFPGSDVLTEPLNLPDGFRPTARIRELMIKAQDMNIKFEEAGIGKKALVDPKRQTITTVDAPLTPKAQQAFRAGELSNKEKEISIKNTEGGLRLGVPEAVQMGTASEALNALRQHNEQLKDVEDISGNSSLGLGRLAGSVAGYFQSGDIGKRAKNVDNEADKVAQVVGSFLKQGVVDPDTRNFYLHMIPTRADTPEVRDYKTAVLSNFIASTYQSQKSALAASGYNVANQKNLNIPEIPSVKKGAMEKTMLAKGSNFIGGSNASAPSAPTIQDIPKMSRADKIRFLQGK